MLRYLLIGFYFQFYIYYYLIQKITIFSYDFLNSLLVVSLLFSISYLLNNKNELRFFLNNKSSANSFLLLTLGVHLGTFAFIILETILILIINIK